MKVWSGLGEGVWVQQGKMGGGGCGGGLCGLDPIVVVVPPGALRRPAVSENPAC